MANNINWGKIYDNTYWGIGVTTNTISWGKVYSDLAGLQPSFALDFDTIADNFTFTRNSFATRVNENGLIETVTDLGSELVTNGNFDTDSNWTLDSGWSIADGIGSCDGTPNASIYQNVGGVLGTVYKIEVTISNYISGTLQIGGSSANLEASANGTFTHYRTWTSDSTLYLKSKSGDGFNGSIDNVSVQEVLEDDLPRIDYSTGEAAFLLEPASTNLILNSNVNSSIWGKVRSSVTTNEDAPTNDGNDGYLLTEDNSLATTHYVIENATVVASDIYTLSAFIKPNGRNFVQVAFESSGYSFDIENGLAGTSVGTPLDYSIDEVGNGFYRVSVTASAVDTVGRCQISILDGDNVVVYDGDGVSGVYIYGIQLEALSYVTSYIPTNGSTVTRAQESCSKSNLTTDGLWGGSVGTVFLNTTEMQSNSTSQNTFSPFRLYRYTGDRYRWYYDTDASFIGNSIDMSVEGGELKMALSVSDTDIKLYVNGTLRSTHTIVISPADVDSWFWTPETKYKERVENFKFYNEALTDDQLTELTTI